MEKKELDYELKIPFFKDCLNLGRVRHLSDSLILFQRKPPLKRKKYKGMRNIDLEACLVLSLCL